MTDFPIGPKTAAFQARIRAMIGQRFGRWAVLEIVPELIDGKVYLLAKCDCGRIKQVAPRHLENGDTRSCGCLSAQAARARKRHGMSRTQIYIKWSGMIARCSSPSYQHYGDYGGRGISVCERWRVFENFFADMGLPPTKKHELDRINNDGNYEPGNVRWATRQDNMRNTRRSRFVTIDGVTQCIAAWARLTGHHERSITKRLDRGMDPKEAVFGDYSRKKRGTA